MALRIVNLALEVDLFLGANLTASLSPDLQKIVVDKIDRLEIPMRLKIDLWSKTKSKVALPYLQDIFIFKHRQSEDWDGRRMIESAISAIVGIDSPQARLRQRDLAITLLIESLYDARFYSKAVEFLTELAPVEAIEGLAGLLNSPDLRNYGIRSHTIEALIKIGTEEAIEKIRDALHVYKLQWSSTDWIQGLGIVAEPAMVEHLIYLIYEPALYTERSGSTYEADRPCCQAISALKRIGGEKVFDWLHQAMYWISAADDEFVSPFHTIVRALFRLDRDRALTALEGAIQSYDPIVRKRAAMALAVSDIPICDRNLSILLDLIEDADLDVQIEDPDIETRQWAVASIVELGIVEVFPIVLKLANHPELVETLIWELKQSYELSPDREIFNEFHRNREVTIEFLETAEKSLIKAIEDNIGNFWPNIFRLGEIGSDLAIPTFQQIIKSDTYGYYAEAEDATRSLAKIGTDAARMALSEIFMDRLNLGLSVFDLFADVGSLGLLPQLWSAYRQTYFYGASSTISKIQERAGLYNPDFSDRSHPLFEPFSSRLRHMLLRDTSTESVDNSAML